MPMRVKYIFVALSASVTYKLFSSAVVHCSAWGRESSGGILFWFPMNSTAILILSGY